MSPDTHVPKELKALQKEANRFARETVRPVSLKLDDLPDPRDVIAEASPFWNVLREAYRLRYHAAEIPQELGGLGLSGVALGVLLEEIGCGSIGFASTLISSAVPVVSALATHEDEFVETFARPFADDRNASWIGCWAMSEQRHGSDVLALGSQQFRHPQIVGELVASADTDAFILNGRKSTWISNGTIATHALLHITIESKGMASRDIVLVPLNLPGISRGQIFNKLGQRELNQGEIIFDKVRVPRSLSITKIDGYEPSLAKVLAHANACLSAAFTGLSRAAYEEAIDHSKKRVQGDKPLCEHQAVQKRIFDMFVDIEASRSLARAALTAEYTGSRPPLELALAAKIFGSEAAARTAGSAIALFGAHGIEHGAMIEKLFRDARTTTAEQGTNDILTLTGARLVFG